jgi:hypothetical protein
MTSGTLPAAPAEEDADACLERRCSRRMALASVSMAAGEEISGLRRGLGSVFLSCC